MTRRGDESIVREYKPEAAHRQTGRMHAGGAAPQARTATALAYLPTAGVVAEFYSHGSSRVFFSATDDRDEQDFRIFDVAGQPRRLSAGTVSQGWRVRPLRPGGMAPGVLRTGPGIPAVGRRAGVNARNQNKNKDVTTNALLPGQRVPARQTVNYRGRLRRDGRLRGRGPLPLLSGAGGHHRALRRRVALCHRVWTSTNEAREVYKRRKPLVEPVTGTIKEQLAARRFLLRSMGNVTAEWALLAAAFNLRTLRRVNRYCIPSRRVLHNCPLAPFTLTLSQMETFA